MGYQPVADIVLILEIQVKSALGNTCLINDISDRCFTESLCCEKIESGFQQVILFELFIYVNFSHFLLLVSESQK